MSDIVCLSHLRWHFVYQRPQHLMSRFGRRGRVFFIEEPVRGAEYPYLDTSSGGEGVEVVLVHVPDDMDEREVEATQRALVTDYLRGQEIDSPVFWYYTPMALGWTSGIEPECIIYDCMDELAAFKDAPAELRRREQLLLEGADLVFTGGESLYEVKRDAHPSVHCFPSSVDVEHFRQARGEAVDPEDQKDIPHPRLGFFGVLDERMDVLERSVPRH